MTGFVMISLGLGLARGHRRGKGTCITPLVATAPLGGILADGNSPL